MFATSYAFYAGEDKSIHIRLTKKELDGTVRPWSIPVGSIITVTLAGSPADLTKTATINNYDLGEIVVDVTETDTVLMKSGDLIVTIQSGSITRIAKLVNALNKLPL